MADRGTMRIKVQNLSLNIIGDLSNRGDKLPVLFLHGFTGRADDWINYFESLTPKIFPFAIDLVGHGQSDKPVDISFYTVPSITNQINEVIEHLGYSRIGLVGYSMGGRIAVSFTAAFPETVKGLVLESTTAGLKTNMERKERVELDNALVSFLEQHSVEEFVDYWLSLPLFRSQQRLPDSIKNLIRSRKRNNAKVGLKNTLRGSGTGAMPSLWESLEYISVPVLLISGGLDTKFTTINAEMSNKLPTCRHAVVDEAGHNVHLEKKDEFIKLVNEFFENIVT